MNINFDLQGHLLDEIEQKNVIIFAGAGISTESRAVYIDTFYDEIKACFSDTPDIPFPDLMEKYQSQPNGRQKLIRKIIDRFRNIDSFRDMHSQATKFHRALATMPYFNRLVTTNWDRYFEEYAGATPFVYDGDINFWETADRAVLKIHGSIDNFSSLVATSSDYAACEQRLRDGPMGAVLKQMLSTKTCVFIGYSATDPDFLSIFQTIRSKLSDMSRTHYLVSPVLSDDDVIRLTSIGIEPVKTDGTFFLETVKSHMCSKFCYANDSSYEFCEMFLALLCREHNSFVESFSAEESPHLLCATFYQDGFIHAIERIIDLRKSGEYSDLHRVQSKLTAYGGKIKKLTTSKDYTEVSYFEGYAAGLILFLLANDAEFDPQELPPLYFHPGVGPIFSAEEYDDKVRQNPSTHKGCLKHCERIVKRMGVNGSFVIQHRPWG